MLKYVTLFGSKGKGRDLEGWVSLVWITKGEGRDLEGQGMEGKHDKFVKNVISPKVE